MMQVTRAWETDGGAVLGDGWRPGAARDAAGDRDGVEVATPAQFTAAVDVTDVAEVGFDLVVSVVAAPEGTRIELVLRGELDLQGGPKLRAAVADVCRAEVGPARAVVLTLDLRDVTFMDSATLHTLADVHAQVAGRGWALRVSPPDAREPRRLLLLAAHREWLPRWRTGLVVATEPTARGGVSTSTGALNPCDGSSATPLDGRERQVRTRQAPSDAIEAGVPISGRPDADLEALTRGLDLLRAEVLAARGESGACTSATSPPCKDTSG